MRTTDHTWRRSLRACLALLLLCALVGAVFHCHADGHDCPLCQSLSTCAAEPPPDLVPAPMAVARPLGLPIETAPATRVSSARMAPRAPPGTALPA